MEGLEKQIRETYERAFWDLVDKDPPDVEHIGKLLEEIIEILCNFVPSRTDIHAMIREDLASVDWELQTKLLKWAERFQAPIYDQVTESWKRKLPEKLSVFLNQGKKLGPLKTVLLSFRIKMQSPVRSGFT